MKPSQQIRAWAIDRAIETLKAGGGTMTAEAVTTTADAYVVYTHDPEAADDAE